MSISNEFIVIASRFITAPLSEKIHRKWPSEFKIQIAIVFRFKIETILTSAVVSYYDMCLMFFFCFYFIFSSTVLLLVRFTYKSIRLSRLFLFSGPFKYKYCFKNAFNDVCWVFEFLERTL